MINTEQLIESLSKDVSRIAPGALASRIGLGILSGALVTTVLVIGVLGIRPDLQVALHGFSFWMKCAYTISLGAGTACALADLARPVSGPLRNLWFLSSPCSSWQALASTSSPVPHAIPG